MQEEQEAQGAQAQGRRGRRCRERRRDRSGAGRVCGAGTVVRRKDRTDAGGAAGAWRVRSPRALRTGIRAACGRAAQTGRGGAP